MVTKAETSETPEQLMERANRLTAQAAEAQAKLRAIADAEREREYQEAREADQKLVDDFDAAALNRAVEEASQRLDQAIAEMPVTRALADLVAAQYRRNWAHVDVDAARGRLGIPSRGGYRATTLVPQVGEAITLTAERLAQNYIDTERAGR